MKNHSLKLKITFIFAIFFVGVLFLPKISLAAIPSTLGWYQIPSTAINSVCACTHGYPTTCGIEGCSAITDDWSGGAFDTLRNRLIIWGGGHGGYYGNEIYTLNLDDLTTTRITNPGLPVAPTSPCTETIAGSQPNSRHTYDQLVYLPVQDKMFAYGGSLACDGGNSSGATWLFDFKTNTWANANPSGDIPEIHTGTYDYPTNYNPNTGKVIMQTDYYTYLYDPVANTWTRVSDYDSYDSAYRMDSVFDPINNKFIAIGSGYVFWWDMDASHCVDAAHRSSCVKHTMTTTGGVPVVNHASPGLAYDTLNNRIIGWAGGDSVYYLNPNYSAGTGTWTPITYSGGPSASTGGNDRIYKRFSWSPVSKLFIFYGATSANGYTLRASDSTPPPSDTQYPSIPTNLSALVVSSGQINLSWTASSDNVGVTGYRIYRNGTQVSTSPTNSYSDAGLSPSTTYIYTVSAYDAAGNVSGQSLSVSATTQASSGGSISTYLNFDNGFDRTLSGWLYSLAPSMFSESSPSHRYFKWYPNDFNEGPDYGFIEIDNTKGAAGTSGSLKVTMTGGKDMSTGLTCGSSITSKEDYLANPGGVCSGSNKGGGTYIYFSNGGYTYNESKGHDRYSMYMYIPSGWRPKMSSGGEQSYDFHVNWNHHNPDSTQPCDWRTSAYSDGELCDPTYGGMSAHFYHYIKVHKGGGWVRVLLDQHPQWERQGLWGCGSSIYGCPNNPTASQTAFNRRNYFDTIGNMYLDQQAYPLINPYSVWVDEMNFYHATETENNDSISGVTVGYFPQGDNKFGMSWQGYASGIGTWEVKYSSSPITNANYSSATLVPLTYLSVSGSPSYTTTSQTVPGCVGCAKRINYDDAYPAAWIDFDLPAQYKVAGATIYFAVKDISQPGQHNAIVGGVGGMADTVTAPNLNIHTISYVVSGGASDTTPPSAPTGVAVN